MKKVFLLFHLLVLLALLACSADIPLSEWIGRFKGDQITPDVQEETSEPDTLSITWQKNITDLQNLFSSISLPDHFMDENPTFQGGEFDLMSVFEILDHIWMTDGYKLAYVYQYDFMGGYPILYAYHSTDSPYPSYQAYLEDRGECLQGNGLGLDCNYLAHVQTDGSELGYLQLLLLDVMGNQFYLFWHAEYNDTIFVATEKALDDIIEDISDPFIPLSRQQRSKASRINPTPTVSIGEETVEIRAVWFTKWGGFYESTYSINRKDPHLISIGSTKNLVEYDCGLMF